MTAAPKRGPRVFTAEERDYIQMAYPDHSIKLATMIVVLRCSTKTLLEEVRRLGLPPRKQGWVKRREQGERKRSGPRLYGPEQAATKVKQRRELRQSLAIVREPIECRRRCDLCLAVFTGTVCPNGHTVEVAA